MAKELKVNLEVKGTPTSLQRYLACVNTQYENFIRANGGIAVTVKKTSLGDADPHNDSISHKKLSEILHSSEFLTNVQLARIMKKVKNS